MSLYDVEMSMLVKIGNGVKGRKSASAIDIVGDCDFLSTGGNFPAKNSSTSEQKGAYR